jgi:hypothetical protein
VAWTSRARLREARLRRRRWIGLRRSLRRRLLLVIRDGDVGEEIGIIERRVIEFAVV